MSPRSTLVLGSLLACLLAMPAHAAMLSTGIDTERSATTAPSPPPVNCDCNVLWFGGDSGNEIARLQSLGYLVTQTSDPAMLGASNLSQYRVLVVAYTGPGVIGAAQADIAAYVSGGHGLLIHQPNHVGAIDYAPPGFGVQIDHVYWCGIDGGSSFYNPTIVNPGHPITGGLADADLSGDFDLVGPYGPAYTVLARNLDCTNSTMALGAGSIGEGHVVFETGNMSPYSFRPGSDTYWGNVFRWLCASGAVPVQTKSWGALKSIYR